MAIFPHEAPIPAEEPDLSREAQEAPLQELTRLRAELAAMLPKMKALGFSDTDYAIAFANVTESSVNNDSDAAIQLMWLKPLLLELRPRVEAAEIKRNLLSLESLTAAVTMMHNEGIRLTDTRFKEFRADENEAGTPNDILLAVDPLLALVLANTKLQDRPSIPDMTEEWVRGVLGISPEAVAAFRHGFSGEAGFSGPDRNLEEQQEMLHLGQQLRTFVEQQGGIH